VRTRGPHRLNANKPKPKPNPSRKLMYNAITPAIRSVGGSGEGKGKAVDVYGRGGVGQVKDTDGR
jgi:hypothetical protein